MQYLLIGGRNLGIKTGQFLKVGTQSSNKLLTSIMNAFGYAATGIGIEPTSARSPACSDQNSALVGADVRLGVARLGGVVASGRANGGTGVRAPRRHAEVQI
jgi:hypothetical protein